MNKERLISTGIYLLGTLLVSIFKDVKLEFYFYSIIVFLILGIVLILLKKLIEIFEDFDKYERLVFIIAHPIACILLLVGDFDSIPMYIRTYLGVFLFASAIYLILSAPYRLRNFFWRGN